MITMLNLLTWKFFLIYLIRESLLNIDVCSADDYLSWIKENELKIKLGLRQDIRYPFIDLKKWLASLIK